MTHPLNILKEEQPWYQEGLNFKCTECGKCCTGSPGYVWVTEQEINAIATHLNLTVDDFSARYVRLVDERYSLLEHAQTYDCAFLKDRKCQIYSVRPKQCRTFPWWPKNLKSKEDWQNAAKFCEGITFQAPRVPLETIQEQLSIHINEAKEINVI